MRGHYILGDFSILGGQFLNIDVFRPCLVFIQVHARIVYLCVCVCMYVCHVCVYVVYGYLSRYQKTVFHSRRFDKYRFHFFPLFPLLFSLVELIILPPSCLRCKKKERRKEKRKRPPGHTRTHIWSAPVRYCTRARKLCSASNQPPRKKLVLR